MQTSPIKIANDFFSSLFTQEIDAMNARHNAEKHTEKTGEPLPDDYQVSIAKLVSPRNQQVPQNQAPPQHQVPQHQVQQQQISQNQANENQVFQNQQNQQQNQQQYQQQNHQPNQHQYQHQNQVSQNNGFTECKRSESQASVTNFDEHKKTTKIELPQHMLQHLKQDENGKLTLELDFNELQLSALQNHQSSRVPEKNSRNNQNSQNFQNPSNPSNQQQPRNKNTLQKQQTKPKETARKWGASAPKTTYIPASERHGDQEARKARRQERAQLMMDEANKHTERMRQMSEARKQKISDKSRNDRPNKTNHNNATRTVSKPRLTSISPSKTSQQQVAGPTLDDRNYPQGINRKNTIALETRETENDNHRNIPRGLDTDVAKNRDRQNRIIEEIRRMKQGLDFKRQEYLNIE